MWGLEVETRRSFAFFWALLSRLQMEAYGSHRRIMLLAESVRVFANCVRMMPRDDAWAHASHVLNLKLYLLRDYGVDMIRQYR
jgi:hypothetical protein